MRPKEEQQMSITQDIPPTIGSPPPFDPTRGHERLELSWRHPTKLFNLSWVNFLLRLVTLGIYHFWAKTEVRKRLWSAIRINDEPLTYTGRGLELFLGFLIVVLIVLLPATLLIAGLMFAFGPQSPVYTAAVIGLYITFFFLFGMAIYRAMRYRLARTRWRGIRGALVGSPLAYAWTYFWTMLLVAVTAGWFAPWRATKLQEMMTNNMRFGDRPFKFTATSGPLYGPFALMWVGGILGYIGLVAAIGITVGVGTARAKQAGITYVPSAFDIGIMVGAGVLALFVFALTGAWYQARMTNHFANHTHFESATFKGKLTAGGLIWLSFSNLLILFGGGIMVLALVALVGLPFIGLDVQELAHINTKPALQAAATVVPLVIVLSLGLLMPIVQARSLRYMIQNLSIEGTAPLADIMQSTGPDVKFGEGLAEAFDVDAI
jgi:uncharacterized membrane protein YjgN (DUF898 family)